MIYLLDTHVLLWLDAEPTKLSSTVSTILKNRENLLLFSYASVWEMQVKQQVGKLGLRLPLEDLLQQQEQLNQIRLFSIRLEHILNLRRCRCITQILLIDSWLHKRIMRMSQFSLLTHRSQNILSRLFGNLLMFVCEKVDR